jgi:hypothetical protein
MSVDSDPSATRLYTLVILCELLVIVALWLLGRAYSV